MTDFRCVPLTKDHAVSEFSCGEPSLDNWLRTEGLPAHRAGTSRTHVWEKTDSTTVLAYFSVLPTLIQGNDISRKMRGGKDLVPGFLLAKLGLHVSLRGHKPKMGPLLLVDALTTICHAADLVGGRLIVVDTVNPSAQDFYRAADFQPIADTARLVMRVATARAALSDRESVLTE